MCSTNVGRWVHGAPASCMWAVCGGNGGAGREGGRGGRWGGAPVSNRGVGTSATRAVRALGFFALKKTKKNTSKKGQADRIASKRIAIGRVLLPSVVGRGVPLRSDPRNHAYIAPTLVLLLNSRPRCTLTPTRGRPLTSGRPSPSQSFPRRSPSSKLPSRPRPRPRPHHPCPRPRPGPLRPRPRQRWQRHQRAPSH